MRLIPRFLISAICLIMMVILMATNEDIQYTAELLSYVVGENEPVDNPKPGEGIEGKIMEQSAKILSLLHRREIGKELEDILQVIGYLNIFEITGRTPAELKPSFRQDDLVNAAGLGYINLVKLLFSLGFDLNRLNRDSFSPLIIAARNGRYEVAQFLLESGADIEKGDEDGLTPLRYAVLFGHQRTADLLLSRGARVNQRDRYRWTPLLSAVANQDAPMVELLLEYGANPELKTTRGEFPLIEAIFYQNSDIVGLLLEGGTNPDVQDIRNYYPALFLALDQRNFRIAEMLIHAGADLNNRAPQLNDTPLMRAVKMEIAETVELLLEKGAEINAVDDKGWSPLFYALERGNLQITNILLKHRIDRKIVDKEGQTPLDLWSWKIDEHLQQLVSY